MEPANERESEVLKNLDLSKVLPESIESIDHKNSIMGEDEDIFDVARRRGIPISQMKELSNANLYGP